MKVLIVDDSVVYRSAIKMALMNSNSCKIVETANNGKDALVKLQQSDFDVITLDIEMPVMDGLMTIQEIRKLNRKIPIIVFSAQNDLAASKAVAALENGASDIVKKIEGNGDLNSNLKMIESELIPRFKALVSKSDFNASKAFTKTANKAYLTKPKADFIGIGSSTGGPETLKKIISEIKDIEVPILIVQHMPPIFTNQLAKSLDKITDYTVVEATDRMLIEKKHIYIAPGDYHMTVDKNENRYYIKLNQNDKVCYVRPAVDVLFESMAQKLKEFNILAYVLTGMGYDGAKGSTFIKEQGGTVLIQDEASSIVWGMPKAVYEAQAFDDILELDKIAHSISSLAK